MNRSLSIQLRWAPHAFKWLNGVFCVYKPTGIPMHQVVNIIRFHLLRDLNALPCYSHERKILREIGSTDTTLPAYTRVPAEMESFSDHRLVLGDRYLESDIELNFLHGLGRHSSGVQVLAVGPRSKYLLGLLSKPMFLRVYHVKGRFGMATHNFSPKGKLIERTTYRHITRGKIDKVCSASQSGHQRLMYKYAKLDPSSQEAYELAAKGLVRPTSRDTPALLYGVKCIDFSPPDFILEVHCINEGPRYLENLIHEIGLELKSTAVCTHVHRVRFGHINLSHTLLRQQWTLPLILQNILQCKQEFMTKDKLTTEHIITKGDNLTKGNNSDVTNFEEVYEETSDPSLEEILENLYGNKVET